MSEPRPTTAAPMSSSAERSLRHSVIWMSRTTAMVIEMLVASVYTSFKTTPIATPASGANGRSNRKTQSVASTLSTIVAASSHS